jgi:hypothetical protein
LDGTFVVPDGKTIQERETMAAIPHVIEAGMNGRKQRQGVVDEDNVLTKPRS